MENKTMEVRKALALFDTHSTAKYALVYANDNGRILVKVLDEPYKVSGLGYDDTIALKDVQYRIMDGVLFLRGTKIIHYTLSQIVEIVTPWGKRNVWKISNHERNDNLVEPFKETDVVLRKWIFFKKTIKAIDMDDISNVRKLQGWYLSKEEELYEAAFANFTLRE